MAQLCSVRTFADNLNRYIERSGKSRAEICEDLGFTYSTLSSWCQGLYFPRIDKIELLARYFHIEKSALIEEQHKLAEDNGLEELSDLLRQLPIDKQKQLIEMFISQVRIVIQ